MSFGIWANAEEFSTKTKELIKNPELLRMTRELAQVRHDRIKAIEKKSKGAAALYKRDKEITAKLQSLDPTGTWNAFVQKFSKDLRNG